jgi:hypothetical protein
MKVVFDPIQGMVSSIESFDLLRKLKCFAVENNAEMLKCIGGVESCSSPLGNGK